MLSKKLLLLSVAASLATILVSPTVQAYNNADLVAVQKGASCPGGDLSGADLSDYDLSGRDFSGTDFT